MKGVYCHFIRRISVLLIILSELRMADNNTTVVDNDGVEQERCQTVESER